MPLSLIKEYKGDTNDAAWLYMLCSKNVMQVMLMAVAYTLRTYGNQFYLGGICKQE